MGWFLLIIIIIFIVTFLLTFPLPGFVLVPRLVAMQRKRFQPLEHGKCLQLGLYNRRRNMLPEELLNLLLLFLEIQRLMTSIFAVADVILLVVYPVQYQAQSRCCRNTVSLLLERFYDGFLWSQTTNHGQRQANHLPNLMQHKALTFDLQCSEFYRGSLRNEWRLALEGHDEPFGRRIDKLFAASEIVEVLRPLK
ncbi:AAEL007352-PA [Aedes aegypti]|uniref:AAEL007352-PA n=1 Tax=Aedes aegypti TaxID=7159 RepID=Q172K3_AEDAE|nr:AAEL007352-PA [Aedes aegypti]